MNSTLYAESTTMNDENERTAWSSSKLLQKRGNRSFGAASNQTANIQAGEDIGILEETKDLWTNNSADEGLHGDYEESDLEEGVISGTEEPLFDRSQLSDNDIEGEESEKEANGEDSDKSETASLGTNDNGANSFVSGKEDIQLLPEEDQEGDDSPEEEELSISGGRVKKSVQELSSPKASPSAHQPRVEITSPNHNYVDNGSAGGETEKEAVGTATSDPKTPAPPPSQRDILISTDHLFEQVTDKNQVTIKDIFKALKAEYESCVFDQELKNAVKERLKALIRGDVLPLDEISDVGEAESTDSEEEASVAHSEYEDEEVPAHGKKRNKTERRKSTSSAAKNKVKAARILEEQQRKRRLEEEKVRNEEMQVLQDKEDVQRAEVIAAKFDTDTDERRLQRLELRLDLLQKLDQRRSTVLQEDPIRDKRYFDIVEKTPTPAVSSGDDEDSDDDMELEIVGEKTHLSLRPKSLVLLDIADKNQGFLKAAKQAKKRNASPGKSMTARASLRRQLLEKKKKMGNLWLARELGYKSEHDHIRDCIQNERAKRERLLLQEQERLKQNERVQLKQRLLAQEAANSMAIEAEEQAEDPDYEEGVDHDRSSVALSDDEEQIMASQLQDEFSYPALANTELSGDTLSSSAVASVNKLEGPSLGEEVPSDISEEPVPDSAEEDSAALNTHLRASVPPASGPENEKSRHAEHLSDKVEISTERKILEEDIQATVVSSVSEGELSEPNEKPLDDSDHFVEGEKSSKPRNSAWKAMLAKEKALHEKMKRSKKDGLVEDEADEEEEEEIAGLEDFGFKVAKKKSDDDEEDEPEDPDDEDFDDVVDDLSDNEGDEEEGRRARTAMEEQEEKERHKNIMRRMREGYDGRRGGIAVGGGGARGGHRFDQLVAADNKEGAKRLGLLNDDELNSDDEGDQKDSPEEEDEAAMLDTYIKNRVLQQSSVDLEENFSDDDDVEDEELLDNQNDDIDPEELEQEKLAKRFSKRARMQRLIEVHGGDDEFMESRLIEQDPTLKEELSNMRHVLSRKRSQSSQGSGNSGGTIACKKQKKSIFSSGNSSLALALNANRKSRGRTTFRRGSVASSSTDISSRTKALSFNSVVFHSESVSCSKMSRSHSGYHSNPSKSFAQLPEKPREPASSLWSKAVVAGFNKRR